MSSFRTLLFRLKEVFHKNAMDRDMTEQMQHHLELMTEENVQLGMTPAEARNAALRKFGGVEQIKEQARDQRGSVWLGQLARDFRLSIRMLRKYPGFTATVVFTLALGIGACTALFSVINTAVLHPFSYPGLDRLVVVHQAFEPKNPRSGASPGDYLDFQQQSTVFTELAAAYYRSRNLIAKETDPARAFTEIVTANFFSTLKVRPILGRDFRADDMVAGKGNVAILSHRLWLEKFGGRAEVIGQTILVDDQVTTVIGVMPADFQAELTAPALYIPLDWLADYRLSRDWRELALIGRLKDNVTVDQANAEVHVIANRLAQHYPETNQGWDAFVVPLVDETVDYARPLLFALSGAVALLLLIACVNTANLLLARATSRQKEVVLRAALGATRVQIMRQFFIESLSLAGLGGLLGVVLAYWGIKLMIAVSPADLPRAAEITVDAHALAFSCAIVLLTGLGFGLVPALQATRVKLNDVLKDGGRGSSTGKTGLQLRNLLVVSEVGFALVLLVSAGLFTRSFVKIQNVDYGYQLKDLYGASIKLSQRKYPDAISQVNFVNRALERVAGVASVRSAAFFNTSGRAAFAIAGQPETPPSAKPSARVTAVTPDYFKTTVIPLRRGRTFTSHDLATSAPAMLISEQMARLYFPNQDPIGQRLKLVLGTDDPVWRVIVGVVGNVRDPGGDPGGALPAQVYLPFTQYPYFSLGFSVRANPGLSLDIRAVSSAVRSLDQDIPISMLWQATTFVDKGMPAVRRFSMVLSVVFSSIALLLAAVGIYGVMAFNVAQRTGEIGIRMALGAQGGEVLRMVLLSGGRMVGLGLLIGLAGALAAARFLGSLLYQLSAYDPITLGAITLILAAVGFLACWLPAHQASKIDPLVALRTE